MPTNRVNRALRKRNADMGTCQGRPILSSESSPPSRERTGHGENCTPALHSAFTHTCCLRVPVPGEGHTHGGATVFYFSGACEPRLAKEKSQKEGKPALVDMRLAGDRREGSQTKPLPSQSQAQWCSEHRRKMSQFLRTHGQLIDQSGQVTISC